LFVENDIAMEDMELMEIFEQLRAAQNFNSCIPGTPFIRTGDGLENPPPALQYNMEQAAGFSAYGTIRFSPDDIPYALFNEKAKTPPPNNILVLGQTLESEELAETIANNPFIIPNRPFVTSQNGLEPITLPDTGSQGPNNNLLPDAPNYSQQPQIDIEKLVQLAANGKMPYIYKGFGNYRAKVDIIDTPELDNDNKALPHFYIIEEYAVTSFLGNYGAGKIVNTFTLLPGERTTITMKSYRDRTSSQAYSENVLDSFSESSAVEMEELLEQENNSGSSITEAKGKSSNLSLSAGGTMSKLMGSFGFNKQQSKTAVRTSAVRQLDKTLNKHVNNSNSNRSVTVNTTSTETFKEGEETSTVRILENKNLSRVLNFVFRQMQQEYIAVTYLKNIRIAFSNGFPESIKVIDLEEIDELLYEFLVPGVNDENIIQVRNKLLMHYCKVRNYQGDMIDFLAKEEITGIGACLGLSTEEQGSETFFRKQKGISDTYTSGGRTYSVDGPILSV
jgi:hypothetical protein